MVYRIFVERRSGFEIEASRMFDDLKNNLRINGLEKVRYINRYDAEGLSEDIFETAKYTVFSEPQTDMISGSVSFEPADRILAVEFLPGQYDQRTDSCMQCIQILSHGASPKIKTARIYIFTGSISDPDFEKTKAYIINPVEMREAVLEKPVTLNEVYNVPAPIETINGFTAVTDDEIGGYISLYSLAMDKDDLKFCRDYFKNEENRDPTVTELKLIDTYWSDHCRHTTFLTIIDDVVINDPYIKETYDEYLSKRAEVYNGRTKAVSLMDLATIGAKYLKKTGDLKDLDESDEINACSVKIKISVENKDKESKTEDWLLMFKNETHNHPTEIEPFGGAATCLGGAIRDPLSGRAYVYQAMRVTGAADPRVPVSETLAGKLPQSKLTQTAANGYSSYGNQIGLATGGVYEIYHPDYVAKRLELGAVIGAVPAPNVTRETPEPGDIVILLGGKTGRDGLGGATGSSKSHTSESLAACGAEVQKGNPIEERKIQRLFRNPEVTVMIKRCNDLGAGGISVGIGELADGLKVDLDSVPVKYDGLDGTELALSESQERMAIVIKAADSERFVKTAEEENLEATVVAQVTEEKRLKMEWNNKTIVNISRKFLNSNGAEKHTTIYIDKTDENLNLLGGFSADIKTAGAEQTFRNMVSDLNVCSQKGLAERFDSSIGASTVVMPFGGKYQLTPPQYMAAKLPVPDGGTDAASVMAYGFDPYLSKSSPYHGAMYAVIHSAAKITASGTAYKNCYLSFQEYFERTKNDPTRWGQPFAALLGALKAQLCLGLGAIGGKDSMSGTFEELDVPPTLVSFAVALSSASRMITPEFKKAGNAVHYIKMKYDENALPDFDKQRKIFDYVSELNEAGKIYSAYATGFGGVAEAVFKMCLGNNLGFELNNGAELKSLFEKSYGSFIIETDPKEQIDGVLLGYTKAEPVISIQDSMISLQDLENEWKRPLEKIFPTQAADAEAKTTEKFNCGERPVKTNVKIHKAKPRVLIAVFPGTNCEYDIKKKFDEAGAVTETFILRNMNPNILARSLEEFVKEIDNSQILMLPGGFSGGDEPDGSAKFIAAVLRNPNVKEAVIKLIEKRDGLILGICNGFQALVKTGLLPYGKIMDRMTSDSPTLTHNAIGRHQSMMVNTRVASVKSPWLAYAEVGDIHTIPASHGEGRFKANEELIRSLAANGQIATQYVDLNGNPTMEIRYNPNGSDYAIEGILSPDGRIFGKMGHNERISEGTALNINIHENKDQKIFKAGADYFN